jgi:energy-coupling factor transport system permease protein
LKGSFLDYQPGDSFIHRLNPVTKLVLSGSAAVTAFVLPDFRGPALLAVLALASAASAGMLGRVGRISFGICLPLSIALFLIHGLFNPENETPLFEVGPLTFWREGVEYAALILFRILTLVCAMLLTVLSTNPKMMMISLMEKGLSPKLAYVFMASLQFIPDMQRRARAILEAQQARGLDVRANLLKRFQALIVIMVPLLTGALISAETRSLALEARGFSRKGPRTHLFDVPDTGAERAVRWAAVTVAPLALLWRLLA